VSSLEEIAGDLDYVLVMTVDPGFGAQEFIPRGDAKIRAIRTLLDRENSSAPISVDGGVTFDNAARIVAAGAGILVAGNAIFADPDPAAAVGRLRSAASPSTVR
jgi:ribulose-phosphate 3-epimerase